MDDLELVPYSALLWSRNWDRLSQQEDEIDEHCRGEEKSHQELRLRLR